MPCCAPACCMAAGAESVAAKSSNGSNYLGVMGMSDELAAKWIDRTAKQPVRPGPQPYNYDVADTINEQAAKVGLPRQSYEDACRKAERRRRLK